MPRAILLVAACAVSTLGARISLTVDPAALRSPGVFSTLGAAQAELRSVLSQHDKKVDVVIHLKPGFHRVPRGGLLLGPEDSPAPGHSVTWSATSAGLAVFSGGENVTGWALVDDPTLPAGVYAAPAPVALMGAPSRQLYINGIRAARTSRPAGSVLPGLELESRADCEACSYAVGTADPLSWSNPADVEFVYSGVAAGWAEPRCGVLSVSVGNASEANCTVDAGNEADCGFYESTEAQCVANRTAAHPLGCCWHEGGVEPSGHWCIAPAYPAGVSSTRITMQQPCFWNLVNRPNQPVGGAPPTSVENVREHLSVPGQWYLDRAAQLVLYFPLPGQDMSSVEAVIPVEETLVALVGASRQVFEGVTFSYATWLRPGQGLGYVEQQAGACNVCPYGVTSAEGCGENDVYEVTPGNVALTGSNAVNFTNCTFEHLGAYAASAGGGSQFIAFRGCTFADVSAGAVMLGGTASYSNTDVAFWDANLTVADCTAINIPVEYSGATTIFAAYVADTVIEHNLIVNASYSAVTLGWGWGREASRQGGNVVSANRIEGALTVRCCDGGGLYTLGPQPGSSLTANYIAQGPSTGNAIYHDNGSGGFTDTSNVIDGGWNQYFFQDDSMGPYGPGAICPDRFGAPGDCGMSFIGNWMRTDATGTTSHVNSTITANTKVAPGSPLPADAAAIVAAAGPRY